MKERNRRAGVGVGGVKCVTIYRTSGQTRLAAAQDGGKVFHKSAAWNLAGGGVGAALRSMDLAWHPLGMQLVISLLFQVCVANAVKQERGRLNRRVIITVTTESIQSILMKTKIES